jgi:hypothetical protein
MLGCNARASSFTLSKEDRAEGVPAILAQHDATKGHTNQSSFS